MKTKLTRETFEQKCYETYQLDWMISHGWSIKDIKSTLLDGLVECVFNGPITDENEMGVAFESAEDFFENSQGFGSGSIYVCMDEFLNAEFQNRTYMEHLISLMPNSKEMEQFWRKEYGIYTYEPGIEVQTSAGVIKAYESPDPGQPGIAVALQPAGTEDEIDLSFVSVYEEPQYITKDGERPVDVCIMTYADPFTEDYTSKDVIKREDVVNALDIDKADEKEI